VAPARHGRRSGRDRLAGGGARARAGDFAPRLALSLAGSVIAAWDAGGNVTAQRVTAAGVPLWGAGVTVGNGAFLPELVSDDAGGALIAWEPGGIQRIDANGTLLWPGSASRSSRRGAR